MEATITRLHLAQILTPSFVVMELNFTHDAPFEPFAVLKLVRHLEDILHRGGEDH